MKSILIVLSACALLLNSGCAAKEEEHEVETTFLVSNPLRMDTALTEEYVCQIHSISHIELRAQERGFVQKIYVDEGQFVKEGQLLFQIMPRLYEAEYQKAKAEADFAEIEYQNTKRLADSNVVAQNELAMAQAKFNQAQAELSLAAVHLQFTQIRAPFDGYVGRFEVRLGSLVDEGDLLTKLSDNSQMWVYFNVPEAAYLDYRVQVKKDDVPEVKLLMANNQLFAQSGKVEVIEADFNNETGNIPFRATFPNPNRLLRHGETGNILMRVPLKNALLIPQKSTFEVLDKKYVYVIDAEHKVRSREITVSAEMPHLYVVSEGLEESDTFLLEGLRLVKENQEIEYRVEAPDSVITHLGLYAE
jgi:membrane fusion protein (multidrug efflux system)